MMLAEQNGDTLLWVLGIVVLALLIVFLVRRL